MKYLILTFLVCISTYIQANPVYNKLIEVNKCWKEQNDVGSLAYPSFKQRTDREWIRIHLSLVEQTLRNRNNPNLTKTQKKNRKAAINYLHQYWQDGAFPINDIYDYRTPIFIDKYNNFCAVGYLVKATGYEYVSRMIAAKTNLAYVKDMNYPELFAWAKEYGFTAEELAWIQPTYGPTGKCEKIGKGVDGVVYELYVDTSLQRLYVGGVFNKADSTITANNVAYITESAGLYTWHNIGSGVVGRVNAIVKYGSNIFVAGIIDSAGGTLVNNVAVWNGSTWQSAGCINGEVRDMIVYRDSLYACGLFSVCGNTTPGNFAIWRGNAWHQIPGLAGPVNTMEVKDSTLYLGGAFIYMGNQQNAIKWLRGTGFGTFSNRIRNEVMDFEVFHDTVYAGCKRISLTDSVLFTALRGNYWDTLYGWGLSSKGPISLNAICANGDTFMAGGDFYHIPIAMGTSFFNFKSVTPNYYVQKGAGAPLYGVDSFVYKMLCYKGRLVFGGAFKHGSGNGAKLNGISIQGIIFNPFPPSATAIKIKDACSGTNGLATVRVYDGKKPYTYLWSNGVRKDTVFNLTPGSHTVIVTDSLGLKDTATVTISNIVLDTTVYVSGKNLYAKTITSVYYWLDCDSNFKVIPGAVYQSYKPSKDGRFAVLISKGGCADTSGCHSFKYTGIDLINAAHVNIYPNPVNDYLNIELDNPSDAVVMLYDIVGKLAMTQSFTKAQNLRLNVSDLPNGVFNITLKLNDIIYHHKFIKQ